jgi:isoleucyl-tRNA synthetase
MSESPDYSKTVHLPVTEFPMKAGLTAREPKQLEAWEKGGLYEKLRQSRNGGPKWVLHDGPPFANGDIHMGTALNRVLKDLAIRFKSMQGFDAPFVPGWDCNGLPIESKVTRDWPKEEPRTPLNVRKRCRQEAEKWIARQKAQFKRLGTWGDWGHPYITLDPAFEAAELEVYWTLLKSGQIYRGLKPVHWCVFDQTALAEAELEYKPHTSDSIYVKFALDEASRKKLGLDLPAFAVIWTTTPWTLPANLAVAAHPDFDYVAVEVGAEAWLLAEPLRAGVLAKAGLQDGKILWRGKGNALDGFSAAHPFLPRASRLVLAPYVTLDEGTTGLVHTAPGHGAEDYLTGVKYGLEILNPVDAQGRYDAKVGLAALEGLRVTDPQANAAVLELLKKNGALVHAEKLEHSYPHCWRCKNPIIFRATEQWFMSLEKNGLRDRTLAAVNQVSWVNPWGRERITGMVKDRADWCISRQRSWGVPIYMFHCADCGEPHFDQACFDLLAPAVAQGGADVWFERPTDFLPRGARCGKCGGTSFKPETDILDVWFDSGSTHQAVLKARPGLAFPADVYLEGPDQYRGWFQSSLWVSMGVAGQPPYKTVVSHGWVLDEHGKAMHKSAGNVVEPQKVIDQYGAEVVRLWAASENFMEDLGIGPDVLQRTSESYRRVRNTFRWLLGNLADYDPNAEGRAAEPQSSGHGSVARQVGGSAALQPFDRWILSELAKLVETCTKHLETWEFQKFTAAYVQFCAVQLSSLAFDVHKDTLYTLGKDDPRRRSAQAAFYQVLQGLVRLGAPVLAFTCEEVWEAMPAAWKDAESVHLASWPKPDPAWREASLEEEFSLLLEKVRPVVTKKLEEARAGRLIGHPYDAEVSLKVRSKKLNRLVEKYRADLPFLFVVSKVSQEAAAPQDGLVLDPADVTVAATPAVKCGRCWRRPGDVGAHAAHPGLCGRCVDAMESEGVLT